MSDNQQKSVENINELVDNCPNLSELKDLITDLQNSSEIDESVVVNLIHNLSHLRTSKTLSQKTLELIDINIIELLMTLIVKRPKLLNDSVLKIFLDYWQEFDLIVEKYICPQNLKIISEESRSPVQSWNKYETILLKMLSKGVTTVKIIESDTLSTLKQEWSDTTLNRFGSCLKSVFDYQKSKRLTDKNSEQFTENSTIDWLSWFCSQSD